MDNKKQKLELTWIGKGEELTLEPRILIEDPSKSYGDRNIENMLIHGDNLLALKALEQDFAGKIKCIYIDPPYNTGSAFEHYDDNLEHSMWLNLMKPRLSLLKSLLREDGLIFVQIDDQEMSYLQVLMDEVFERSNRVNIIVVKMSESSGVKMAHVEKKLPKMKEYLLVYRKGPSATLAPVRISKADQKDIDSYLKYYGKIIENPEDEIEQWRIVPVKDYMHRQGLRTNDTDIKSFKLANAERVVYRTNNRSFSNLDIKTPLAKVISATGIEYVWWEGKQMLFLSDYTEEYLGDLWTDISTINLNKEGGVDFANGKKPEALIRRILNMSTKPSDYVLDSFLGSGSTAAVAHKMKRRWIGVELGEQSNTHCLPRLKSIVDGTEQGGITRVEEWKGGGGFKFFNLAPSLLKQDKFGNWIIEEKYNAHMLAAAMAKQEGFRLMPDESVFWKQARSTEKDFLFTTTQFMTLEMLDSIHSEMQPEESLLIACKAYHDSCENKYPNITIKKIPQILLGRCEYGKDDYSLNIVNAPVDEEPLMDAPVVEKKTKGRKKTK